MGYFAFFAQADPALRLVGVLRLLYGAMQWWAIAAACGFAYRHLNLDSPLRRALSTPILCVYILHQAVIIGLTRALAPLQPTPLGEGLLLIAPTLRIRGSAYLLLRLPLLRGAFGITSSAPAPSAATIRARLSRNAPI